MTLAILAQEALIKNGQIIERSVQGRTFVKTKYSFIVEQQHRYVFMCQKEVLSFHVNFTFHQHFTAETCLSPFRPVLAMTN